MIINAKPFQTKGMGGWLDDLLGTDNAAKIEAALKTAGATAVTNVIGNTVQQNPSAVAALQSTLSQTGNSFFSDIWVQYKTPIIIGSSLLAVVATLGIYNTFRK